ncbi:MAG: hypothetical protein ABSC06_19975 [Rhodopila sp.]|jgi:hypothetical protein
MIQYLYLGRVGYDEALRLQAEIAALVAEGRLRSPFGAADHCQSPVIRRLQAPSLLKS